MGCFPWDFQEGKRALRHSEKRPIEEGKRLIKEGKRPINTNGLFSGTPPWWKTAPLKRPIKRSMMYDCQRTLVIRIAAITLVSDSAMTIARCRPSKQNKHAIVTGVITKLIFPEHSPVTNRPNISKNNPSEFQPVIFGSVFSKCRQGNGNELPIDPLGIYLGNYPVADCRKDFAEQIFWSVMLGDRDTGGSNLRKLEGGENFEFSGAPEIDPFLQRFDRESPIYGSKSKSSRGNFRGEFPPSSVRYVLTPPIPVSEVLVVSMVTCTGGRAKMEPCLPAFKRESGIQSDINTCQCGLVQNRHNHHEHTKINRY